jgi:hypothetical protein
LAVTTARRLADLSGEFLAAVKRGQDDDAVRSELAALDEAALAALGDDEDAATAFWVNCYNAAAQVLLREAPSLYEDRRRFFSAERLTVAGTDLSLDDVEHGILRSSKWKYGLGYLPQPFPGEFERRHRRSEVDPRIHFALNCGAASCPPILAYTAAEVDDQLDEATRSFLEQSSTYDSGDGEVTVTRLFLYYRGDFGGRSGIYDFLERYGVVDEGDRPKVRYDDYDWSRRPEMYRAEED